MEQKRGTQTITVPNFACARTAKHSRHSRLSFKIEKKCNNPDKKAAKRQEIWADVTLADANIPWPKTRALDETLNFFLASRKQFPCLEKKKSIENLPELKRSGSHPVLQPSPKHLRTTSTLRLYSDHEIPSQGRLGKGHRTGKWKEKMKVSHGQLQPTGKQSLCEISLWNLSIITCFTTSYY